MTTTTNGWKKRTPAITIGELYGRQPPRDETAEMNVLGSLLLDVERRFIGPVCEILTPEDFTRAAHVAIFRAIERSYHKHAAVDIAALQSQLVDSDELELVGGPEYLVTLANSVAIAHNAEMHALRVREIADRRRVIGSLAAGLDAAYRGDPESAWEGLESGLSTALARHHARTAEATDLASLLAKVNVEMEQRAMGGCLIGISSGFADLDEITVGFQAGDLIILAARPSIGKTALALCCAHNAGLLGVPVGVFSMEMSKEQIAKRLLCIESGVDSQHMRRNLLSKDEFKRLGEAEMVLNTAPIHIDDTAGMTITQLRSKCRQMVKEHEVKMIIVDYLQLMTGSNRESRQNDVAEISRGVKAIARELNVPMMCLSQLNRASENRENHRPRMADLRESGAIEQDADVVLMLHREDYYKQGDDSYDPTNIAELIIAKQRNGPTGMIKLVFVPQCSAFKSMAYQSQQQDFGQYQRQAPAAKATQCGEIEYPPSDEDIPI